LVHVRLIDGFKNKSGTGTFKAVLSRDDESNRLTWKFPNSNVFKIPMDLLKPLVVYEPPVDDTEREFEAIEREALALKHPCKVVGVKHGPRITQYQLQPNKGINIADYKKFKANFQAALLASKLSMYIPIPGTNLVGIEIPTKHPYPVQLRGLLENEEYQAKKKPLSFTLGQDLYGRPFFADLASMPHLLVAGATGAGKPLTHHQ
jgi:DNA segregation ATPase FtsK/SpoIIIE-like protein